MAYIINTGIYFIVLYCTSQILHILQIEGLWQPVSSKSIGGIFSNGICSLHVSVSHFHNSCNISNPLPAERLWLAKGCILSPCLFNFYAEYIMRNSGLEEAQAGIKNAGRNISNLSTQMTPLLRQKVQRN